MKTIILAAFTALSMGAIGVQAATYHAPAHNFYQNNWMGGE